MSKDAVEYVRGLRLADPGAAQVFMLLAERTSPGSGVTEDPRYVMGLELEDAEIPSLADRIGIDAEEFRCLLRQLKATVPMDVLELSDGVWEIVYGLAYTDPTPTPAPRPKFDEANLPQIKAFAMPGWERYSTWGSETHLGHLYAQLYLNTDDRDADPGSGSPRPATSSGRSTNWPPPSPKPSRPTSWFPRLRQWSRCI
ncbi:MAG TPA: hypothetical protein VL551_33915 [Actinospica sp.]|nr:hypothetical protein [Actinospica sp.]